MSEDFVQLRALNEASYCEKLYYLMYVDGVFYDSADTINGSMAHKKREAISALDKLEGANLYSFVLYDKAGLLSAKLDGVLKEGNEYIPIEDKNSKKPVSKGLFSLWGIDIKTEAWSNDFAQIVGQMYLLRQNGYECKRGRIYYRGSNQMIEIAYEDQYDEFIKNGVKRCIDLMHGEMPESLKDSDKCIRCSLNWACLPDETNYANNKCTEVRRLYPGRPDGSTLYVTKVGSKIGKSGECFNIFTPEEEKITIPTKDVENVCLYGNTQISTQAMCEIIENGGSVFYFSSGGWLKAVTSAPLTKNINLRIKQFRHFKENDFDIILVRSIVRAKILNQRTLLRRNHKESVEDALLIMKQAEAKVRECNDIDSIRGFEGLSAKTYWDAFPKTITDADMWKMDGRNRRPPKDEINAMLSYGYSLLLRDFVSAIMETGLDYLHGFYHVIQPGRPALALDMMEPYRPIIVDSVVLRLVNEHIITKSDFAMTSAGVYMKPETKKKIIYMYEQRMDEMITHPQFGYRLSYRRMIALEAKLLGKYINGEMNTYMPLITR